MARAREDLPRELSIPGRGSIPRQYFSRPDSGAESAKRLPERDLPAGRLAPRPRRDQLRNKMRPKEPFEARAVSTACMSREMREADAALQTISAWNHRNPP